MSTITFFYYAIIVGPFFQCIYANSIRDKVTVFFSRKQKRINKLGRGFAEVKRFKTIIEEYTAVSVVDIYSKFISFSTEGLLPK